MRRILILIAGLAACTVGCATAHDGSKTDVVEVTLDQVPPAVMQTLTRESGGAPIGKIERGGAEDKHWYRATETKNAQPVQLTIDESGKVIDRKPAK